MTEARTRTRMRVLGAVVVFLLGALATRLWFLQVLASEQYAALADQNQVRLVPIDPVRGMVLDRSGRVLVGNRPSTVVVVDRSEMRGREEEVLFRLSNLLHVPVADFMERLQSKRYLPFEPVPVAEDVPEAAVFYIREHPDLFPGVSYRVEAVREYPNGKLAAHVLGYVGEISEDELRDPRFRGYRPGQVVGKAGVERVYERFLRGTPGTRGIRVNAQGRVLDANFRSRPPTPGDNLVLSIDREVQALAERSLDLGIQLARRIPHRASGRYLRATGGAVIVMDPRNGQVLAMASNPTFDPAIFLGGLTRKEGLGIDVCIRAWRPCPEPSHHNPLLNRAIQSSYPPGSTFKPFIAAAGIREGFVSTQGYYPCPPAWQVPGTDPSTVRPFRNWSFHHYGYITLADSLVISCDTVYYPIGWDFSVKYFKSGRKDEALQNYLRRMGFGLPTGIDLPSESSGVIPTDEYKRKLFLSAPDVYCVGSCEDEYPWRPGDYINMSIGQGFVQVTPIQLAVAFSALANGGILWQPHVALRVETPDGEVVRRIRPKRAGRLPVSREVVAYLRNALRGVPERGTAHTAFAGFPLDRIPVAGKTGTADIVPRQPYSWFAAMAPADRPRYVVVAMVEEGGHGSTTAAPVVRRILEGLFGLNTSGDLRAGEVAD